jgi:hypothetical protein
VPLGRGERTLARRRRHLLGLGDLAVQLVARDPLDHPHPRPLGPLGQPGQAAAASCAASARAARSARPASAAATPLGVPAPLALARGDLGAQGVHGAVLALQRGLARDERPGGAGRGAQLGGRRAQPGRIAAVAVVQRGHRRHRRPRPLLGRRRARGLGPPARRGRTRAHPPGPRPAPAPARPRPRRAGAGRPPSRPARPATLVLGPPAGERDRVAVGGGGRLAGGERVAPGAARRGDRRLGHDPLLGQPQPEPGRLVLPALRRGGAGDLLGPRERVAHGVHRRARRALGLAPPGGEPPLDVGEAPDLEQVAQEPLALVAARVQEPGEPALREQHRPGRTARA